MTASAERQKLRDTIEAQTNASHKLDEAQIARTNAQSRWSAANSKVGEIVSQIEEAEGHAEGSSDSLISSLASGADLAVLDKPRTLLDELRAQLAEAENESARWRDALKTAEEAVEVRKRALDMAAFYVDSAAKAVVGAELNIASMLCAAEALRDQLLNHQAKLAALSNTLDFHDPQRQTIDNFVNDVGWLLDSPWRNRPAAQPIKDMFDRLKGDAGASLEF